MAARLGPTALPALIEDHVEEHRSLFCSSYDACLGRAIEEEWASWTCTHCLRFQAIRRTKSAPATECAAAPPHPCVESPPLQPGSSTPAPAPPPACEAPPRPSHRLRDEGGSLQLQLEAPSAPALFVEAARAVAEVVRGPRLEPRARRDEEISIAAPDAERLLAAWIDELVRRSVRSRVRFEECEIVYLSERRLVAWIGGVRLARIDAPLTAAPGCHDPHLVLRAVGVTAAAVLEP